MKKGFKCLCDSGAKLNVEEYGHKWKKDGPTEVCDEDNTRSKEKCQNAVSVSL